MKKQIISLLLILSFSVQSTYPLLDSVRKKIAGSAGVKKAKELGKISASGRTIRKIFNNEHVRESTIKKLIKELGMTKCMRDGKIDIENEQEKETNTTADVE